MNVSVSFLQVVLTRTNLSVSCFTCYTDLYVSSSRIKQSCMNLSVSLASKSASTRTDLRVCSTRIFRGPITVMRRQGGRSNPHQPLTSDDVYPQ